MFDDCVDEIGIELHDPLSQILGPLTGGLWRHPQLKVVDTVLVPLTVLVMDVLVRQKRPTEVLLHDEAMFHYLSTADMQDAITVLGDQARGGVIERATSLLSVVMPETQPAAVVLASTPLN